MIDTAIASLCRGALIAALPETPPIKGPDDRGRWALDVQTDVGPRTYRFADRRVARLVQRGIVQLGALKALGLHPHPIRYLSVLPRVPLLKTLYVGVAKVGGAL
jgi:hypothetical protein